ncbi:AraC family transcriptional regulator [Streptomyces shenzhenensis]|uniref:AraC family transcriptional regulator n=1 Tax=Streptomyces shenzhenensis TaxID=943815 RepID=UPI0033F199D2
MRHTHLHLGEPPLVASVGVGVYGVASPADVFRPPGLGQPHLYGYGLGVDGTPHLVRPGRVRLVPSGETVATAGGAAPSTSARGFASPSRAPRTAFPSPRTPDLNVRCAEPLLGQAVAAVLRASRAAGPRSGPAVAHSQPGVRRRTPRPPPGGERRRRPHRGGAGRTADRAVGVSHNQLTRLFRAATGVGCVRRRGLDRARHLLCASTPSVGVPGPQALGQAC